ncbi:MAG: hypothetical protein HY897_08615 [Deltaproteobacteria bacterium]|nr:hypothetical protein [Deltaproteobacteria bacterium]
MTEKELKEHTAVYEPKGTLDDVGERHTLEVLNKHDGHRANTAKELGIGLATLKRRLKLMGISGRGSTAPAA